MARLAISVVGAAAGFAIGGPLGAQIGWMAGSIVGNLVLGADGPQAEGPRISDLMVQSSAEGVGIPIVFGRARLAGNIIWAQPIKETRHEEEVGGKGMGGGGTQISYTYSVSFAVGLCEGVITGVRKIWADSKLIFDVSGGATADTLNVSYERAKVVRVYSGGETQTADPTIQSFEGAANTPPYRGLAYLVFEDLELADFANHVPNITVEVISAGSETFAAVTDLPGATTTIGIPDAVVHPPTGRLWVKDTSTNVLVYDSNLALLKTIALSGADPGGSVPTYVPSTGEIWVPYNIPNTDPGPAPFKWTAIAIFKADSMTLKTSFNAANVTNGPALYNPVRHEVIVFEGFHGSRPANIYNASTYGEIQNYQTGTQLVAGGQIFRAIFIPNYELIAAVGFTDFLEIWTADSYSLLGRFVAAEFDNLENFIAYDSRRGVVYYASSSSAILYKYNCATNVFSQAVTLAFAPANGIAYSEGRDQLIVHYGAAGSFGTDFIDPDLFAVVDTRTGTTNLQFIQLVNDALMIAGTGERIPIRRTITSTTVLLSSVVSTLCTKSGLTVGDLDVTALTDAVDGYVIPRPMVARAAIEQLRQAYFFDGTETDNKIKFVKRGGASAATLIMDDLAAHEFGQQMPDPLRIARAQEMELPVEVHIGYIDRDNDYLPGNQEFRRLTTSSKNQIHIDLPIALSSDKASQIADVLTRNAWIERHRFQFSLMRKFARLDPTDTITIPTPNGGQALVRLTRTDHGASGLIECDALADDTILYSSAAVGNDAGVNEPQVLNIPTPTTLALLDAPLVREADNEAGFYVAASGYTSAWRGCTIYKSVDQGATWDATLSILSASTMGWCTTKLENFTGNIWDHGELTVSLVTPGGALSSATELAVYAGANAALVGEHGRWELIQFMTATLNGDGTYTIRNMLRGRQGSDHANNQHVIGDRFILLTSATTRRFLAQNSEIGLARKYRGVSIGRSLEQTEIQDFTNSAVGLECYSPVQLGGGRNAVGDIIIIWERRTRLDGAWRDDVDVGIGEASESYEVEILTTDFATLKRTFTGLTSKTVTYTTAQQVTDFGSNQASIGVRAYQISAVVARGYQAQATV